MEKRWGRVCQSLWHRSLEVQVDSKWWFEKMQTVLPRLLQVVDESDQQYSRERLQIPRLIFVEVALASSFRSSPER